MNSLKRVYQWFHKLPKQIQDSIFFSVSVVGFFPQYSQCLEHRLRT